MIAAAQALIRSLAERGLAGSRVLEAMAAIPRERFVPDPLQAHAWEDIALPIGQGQTISQPAVVAQMTEALAVGDRMKVLEIGTGSGYQTAILAKLARRVYTIERHQPLLKGAEAMLASLRIANVTAKFGDGGLGWPEQAPFDRVMVTAAADGDVPATLLAQVKDGGILVVPVAHSPVDQRLYRLTRHGDHFDREELGPVRFVPLVTGQAGPEVPRARSLG
ncbi:MAG: protein-L-isoaspartate(D-aspartate) O-methyltransferase [Alphaproteobacteria bacterium]|nr:protein-L-isoaspartate(D-aspartate) O-methyltransferase [Alphaproteobacteria bacterium]TAD88460.1 MAG: protein-L-isoaspartate(D-aspartate) O-methyltransferase [Alphaproteobacteria bacterium]